MVIMKFTNQIATVCQTKKIGYIWVNFRIVTMLCEKQRKLIQQLMVATTAHQRAIHLSDALVLYYDLCKYEQLF